MLYPTIINVICYAYLRSPVSSLSLSKKIKTLLSILNFDKNKVILGKSLYGNCIDPENFYVVYDAINFNSDKKELMNYISQSNR